MYGYEIEYDGLDCYHGAFALGGDSDKKFARHHWMIDSGCTDNLSPFKDDFAHLGNQVHHAIVANRQKVSMYNPGKIIIQSKDEWAEPLVLSEVWYAPHAAHRLMSVPTLTSQGYRCTINDRESNIWNANERLVIQAKALSPENNLHWFQSKRITPTDGSIHLLAKEDSYNLWHHCLGHPSKNALHAAPSHVTGMPSVALLDTDTSCKGCTLGKMHDRPYPPSGKCATHPLGLVHSDLVGPIPTESRSCACYVLTFIDDHSGFAVVVFLRTKDAVSQHFKSMVSWAETFTSHSPLYVQTEGGNLWLGCFSCSFSPEGSCIRCWFLIPLNRMVVQRDSIELCLRKQKPFSNMHVCLVPFGKTLLRLHCIYIIDNQCIVMNGRHPLNNSMETNLMFPISGYLEHLHMFLYVSLEQWQDKLSPKSEEMIFIGYEPNTKGYCFWSKERRRVFISMNAIFNEKAFSYCSRNKEDRPTPIPVKEEDPIDDLIKDDTWWRDLEPSWDILVSIPLGLGHQPDQPRPLDDGHSSV